MAARRTTTRDAITIGTTIIDAYMKLRTLIIYLFCIVASAAFATGAAADRRVALVIGNSAYRNAPSLKNTINDATAIATMLKSSGFEVVIPRTDLGVVDFKRAVREFLLTAENADIAVVYYAGHGVEMNGTNYLIPVDARLSRDYDVEDEAVSLDRLIWALQSVRRLRLIMLDACRDNPFASRSRSASMRSTMKGGLGKLEDVGADTLVAYAAKAGSVSYDGDGANSPYATALVRHLTEPGVDIRIALGKVRDDVIDMTGGRQEPFIYGSLGGATIALVPATPAPAPPPQQVSKPAPQQAVPGPVAAAPPQIPARVPPVAAAPSPPQPAPPAPVAAAPPPAAPPPSKPPANAAPPQPITVARADPQPPAQQVPRTAVDPNVACPQDEQRLAQLRADPSPEQVVKFARELTCQRLESQVRRLLESVSIEPLQPDPPNPSTIRQAQAQPLSQQELCARDGTRLSQLRADPSADGIMKFERELGCEHLRPQLQRLRESMGL
jgi:hypothetical protein